MKYLNYLIDWIKKQVEVAKARGVIVGISGGIDSALVAYLAKQAFPNNSLGILMPINKERHFDLEDGLLLVKQLDLNYKIIDLSKEYQNLKNKINISDDLICGNMQARLRMTTLYALAQANHYLVLGTDNKAEYELGYFTKYGDGGCDLLPIVHLYKSQVYEYAKMLELPQSIIAKKPSAGLWPNQNDECELGFLYSDFEKFKSDQLDDKSLIQRIQNQINVTDHKRKPIPKPKTLKELMHE